MRILVVEDEVKIRTGIAKLISAHTAHKVVGEARTGKDGLEMIRTLRPQVVISDIRMPGMDGLEMLRNVKEEGIPCHFILLSGYSEFEYAQKALRYGVDDYLLKPLSPEDLTAVLEKVEKRIKEEAYEGVQSAEGLVRDILLGEHNGTPEEYERIKKSVSLDETVPCYLAAGYLGDTKPGYTSMILEQLTKWKTGDPQYEILAVSLESTRELFCLINGPLSEEELCDRLRRRFYRGLSNEEQPVWTVEKLESLNNLKKIGDTLRSRYLYGCVYGYRDFLTGKQIASFSPRPARYPTNLENLICTAICQDDEEALKKETASFEEFVSHLRCEPALYRKLYVKLLTSMENTCSEVNEQAYRRLTSRDLVRSASDAVTIGELRRCLDKAVELIGSLKDRREDIRNYTIRRAIGYIREHYRENISLELIASQLEITPEYLSTLFNREVGVNFTVFLKQFRISYAKRLLKSTDRKVYEISEEVGYNDPKYFNRVFKEEVGVSPGEYRQANRWQPHGQGNS